MEKIKRKTCEEKIGRKILLQTFKVREMRYAYISVFGFLWGTSKPHNILKGFLYMIFSEYFFDERFRKLIL